MKMPVVPTLVSRMTEVITTSKLFSFQGAAGKEKIDGTN
jgi:hypothetical protein